jgi:hypothetical protein
MGRTTAVAVAVCADAERRSQFVRMRGGRAISFPFVGPLHAPTPSEVVQALFTKCIMDGMSQSEKKYGWDSGFDVKRQERGRRNRE